MESTRNHETSSTVQINTLKFYGVSGNQITKYKTQIGLSQTVCDGKPTIEEENDDRVWLTIWN